MIAGLMLCAHVESKSMLETAVVLCIGWFGGTHYWNVTSKKEFTKLNEKMDGLKVDLQQAINENKDEVISAIKEQLEQLKGQAANLRKEDMDELHKELASIRGMIQTAQEAYENQLKKVAADQLEQNKKVDQQYQHMIGHVEKLHRDTAVNTTIMAQLGENVKKQGLQINAEVKFALSQYHTQQVEQLSQNEQNVTTQLRKTQTYVSQQLQQHNQNQITAFEELKKEFIKNADMSEQKMAALVGQSETAISIQIQLLQTRTQEFESKLQVAKEEDKIFIVSQMTAFQEENQRQLNQYLGAFEAWQKLCEQRFSKLESGQKKHDELIIQLKNENTQLRMLIEKQGEKLDSQAAVQQELLRLLKTSVALAQENKEKQEETQLQIKAVEKKFSQPRQKTHQVSYTSAVLQTRNLPQFPGLDSNGIGSILAELDSFGSFNGNYEKGPLMLGNALGDEHA